MAECLPCLAADVSILLTHPLAWRQAAESWGTSTVLHPWHPLLRLWHMTMCRSPLEALLEGLLMLEALGLALLLLLQPGWPWPGTMRPAVDHIQKIRSDLKTRAYLLKGPQRAWARTHLLMGSTI